MTKLDKPSIIGGLQLRRKVGDKITINNGEIMIEVVEIRGQSVKLAFAAHREISIRRAEVKECSDIRDL